MIRIYKFNESWQDYFKKEKALLSNVLVGKIKLYKIEHIGATSVVLCNTVGTIDLLLSIQSSIDMFTVKNLLMRNGYEFVDSKSTTSLFVFHRKENGNIVATVRLVEFASIDYNRIKLFKFYLREKNEHAIKYNEFRYSLALTANGDYKKYEEGKAAYIESILDMHCETK